MNESCSCFGSGATIRFRDVEGRNIMIFIRLCSGAYFGGRTHESVPFVSTPHHWMQLGGMFNLIARLAHETEDPLQAYWMDGNGWDARIERQMQASDIARVLGCDLKEVTDHFAFLIKVVAPEPVL